MAGWREGGLQHGEYVGQGSTRGAEPVADTYMHPKRFFFPPQGIALCNYGGWLSKTDVSGTGRQERKIPKQG